jgi:hypothetical protein
MTNNMFGMRPALRRRKFYSSIYTTGGNGQFASYDTPEDGILDRLDLDVNFNRDGSVVTSQNAVISYMNEVFDDGYTHETNYVSNWLSLYNSLFSGIAVGATAVLQVGSNSDGTVYEGNGSNDDSGNGEENANGGDGDMGFKLFSLKNIIYIIVTLVTLITGYRLFKK